MKKISNKIQNTIFAYNYVRRIEEDTDLREREREKEREGFIHVVKGLKVNVGCTVVGGALICQSQY